ncbi:pantoate--beta-alanine ligase [Robiginitalea sp.]|uniref:pantoate--beta-alanine ligase n=1 Tax=Robiginitalea sp. TaxID=1902411 RepID=UPI003C796993
MNVLRTKDEIGRYRKQLRQEDSSLGLVPTMGALHKGHLELVRRACRENDSVLVTIFVNPTQFNNSQDLLKYPKTLESDLDKLRDLDCAISVFAPEVSEMYGASPNASTYDFGNLERVMEGVYRPGHFNGVATIVEVLLRLILPDRVYFGEKDYQQLQIVRQMVQQKGIPVTIVPCPIVREADGLAMSSRNTLLTNRLRNEAGFLYKLLGEVKKKFGTKNANEIAEFVREALTAHPDFKLEYFSIADAETLQPVGIVDTTKKYRAFIAAYLGEVRLIDNLPLN